MGARGVVSLREMRDLKASIYSVYFLDRAGGNFYPCGVSLSEQRADPRPVLARTTFMRLALRLHAA
jgi:hypothetical protein